MNIRDFAIGIIETPPSPASSGTSLTLQTGQGDDMPEVPFSALAAPPGVLPTKYNSEKVTVTAITGDTLTIERAQGETTAQEIEAGWLFSNNIFTEDLSGGGDVVGPESSTNDAIARFDGETGKLIKGSGNILAIDDTGATLIGAISPDGTQVIALNSSNSAGPAIGGNSPLGLKTVNESGDIEFLTNDLPRLTVKHLGGIDTHENKLINVADPTDTQDAATKKYVDDNSGGGAWGEIVGTLSDQTDLQGALDDKVAGDGVNKITASDTEPSSPEVGDLWIDTDEPDPQDYTDVLKVIYRVGSYYWSDDPTSPATVYGFGTWERVQGRFIVGASDTDGDFDVGDTGGAKTHNHTLDNGRADVTATGSNMYFRRVAESFDYTVIYSASGGSTSTGNVGFKTRLSGSADSSSSLPPYRATYIWRRTA